MFCLVGIYESLGMNRVTRKISLLAYNEGRLSLVGKFNYCHCIEVLCGGDSHSGSMIPNRANV